MPTILTKQHDTHITFVDYPTINNVPVPPATFAGCTLSFIIKDEETGSTIKQPAQINPDGSFSYEPIDSDVATADTYQQEWEVVFPDATILTFPNNTYNTVKILPDLG